MTALSEPITRFSGPVWHYTDAGGLLGMLEHNELWASSYLHLNDGAEVTTGITAFDVQLAQAELSASERSFVANHLEQAKGGLLGAQTFILSASMAGDSLSQWRGYAGGSGFAVCLDGAEALDLVGRYPLQGGEEEADSDNVDVWQYVSPWRSVVYDEVEQATLARDLIEEFRKLTPKKGTPKRRSGLTPWSDLLARLLYSSEGYTGQVIRMKDDGFSDEREVRMYATIEDAKRFQHVRPTRFGLTPYVRLTGGKYHSRVRRPSYATTKCERLPIREVRIGPTPHVAAAKSGLEAAFRQFGYEHVEISVSKVPYR